MPDEPAEIRLVKEYVRENFRENVHVAVRKRDIMVTVRSSALAGTLRARGSEILRTIGVDDKRLVFRIGRVEEL